MVSTSRPQPAETDPPRWPEPEPTAPRSDGPRGTDGTARAPRRPAGAIVGLVLAVALAVGLVLTRATPGYAAAKQPSYCSASLAVDHYLGHSDAAVHALLARVLAVAPVDVVTDVKTMRAAPLRSTRYTTAKDRWSRYNNNHCCTCIGGTSTPHVVVTPIH